MLISCTLVLILFKIIKELTCIISKAGQMILHTYRGKTVSPEGHLNQEHVHFYWSISQGTEAINRGMEAIAFAASVMYQA